MADGSKPMQVQSVARALAVLEHLATASESEHTLTRLAVAVGIRKSSMLALLNTLKAAGIIRLDTASRFYELGPTLVWLGSITKERSPIGQIALPVLTHLSDVCGLMARAAVFTERGPVFIRCVPGRGAIRIQTPLGQPECITTTAAGKIQLATMPTGELEATLSRCGCRRRTANSILERAAMLRELDKVRQMGFATDLEEDLNGVACVAAGIRDETRQWVGAVSITGLRASMTAAKVSEYGALVKTHAEEISLGLGYR